MLVPSSGSYENVVFFFHGLGDTADGWARAMPDLALENTKFILPTAPSRPISLNGGYSMPGWSDIFGLDESAKEDRKGFDESSERINSLIQMELDKNINPSKIVLAGFSQGGALALHTALRSQHTLGGCIGLSTWLPFNGDYPSALSPSSTNLPIFQAHGTSDAVVRYQWGQNTHNMLKSMISDPEPEFLSIPVSFHLTVIQCL